MAGPGEQLRTVYFDHGATSWPKPPEVVAAVTAALTEFGGNPGRGAYRLALSSSRLIHESRRALAGLLGVPDARDLLFQPSCTQALNLVLRGLLKPGDRVVTTSVEHNAVSRPLAALQRLGVEIAVVNADADGLVALASVTASLAEKPTRALVCQHASNLTGAIQPLRELAAAAHEVGALAISDGAQAAGHLGIDLRELGVDAWACSGHKGLLGPQGVGALWLSPDIDPEPLVLGGTGGGSSADAAMPAVRPDRYEAGTPNTPGIAGLGAAAVLLAEQGPSIRAEEARLTGRLHEGILAIGGFRVLGPPPGVPRVPVLAVVHETVGADQLASALDRRFGVAVRAGLHCAPWAHETSGTLASGALRFGLGWSTTDADVDAALEALSALVEELA